MKSLSIGFAFLIAALVAFTSGVHIIIVTILAMISIGFFLNDETDKPVKIIPGNVWFDGRVWHYSVYDEDGNEYIQPVAFGCIEHAETVMERFCANPRSKSLFIHLPVSANQRCEKGNEDNGARFQWL